MKDHYVFVREIREKVRHKQDISMEENIDYYWALHRLHESKAKYHERLVPTSGPDEMKVHVRSRNRHYAKATYYKKKAEEFEEEAFPGLLEKIDSHGETLKFSEDYTI